MVPYIIAHLKLDIILKKTGYTLNNERLQVYLTNSLNPPMENGQRGFPWLTAEAEEADAIKTDTPVMVVIGNPPYNPSSKNNGDCITGLLDEYTCDLEDEPNIKSLSDDYVKFIRYGQNYFDNDGKDGILAYITNNSFLDGVIHRQMRKSLLKTFDKIYIINLHGNKNLVEVCPDGSEDLNVFNIQQGVSINIFIKKKDTKVEGNLAEVFYCDVYGKEKYKHDFLTNNTIDTVKLDKLEYSEPYYFFASKDFSNQEKYERGFSVKSLFDNNKSGIATANNDGTIKYKKEDIELLVSDINKKTTSEILIKYPTLNSNAGEWKTGTALKAVKAGGEIVELAYKPFDNMWTFYHKKSGGFLVRPRFDTMKHMLKENVGLCLMRGFKGTDYLNTAFVSNKIMDLNFYGYKTSLFPLYLYADDNNGGLFNENGSIEHKRKPNLDMDIVNKIESELKLRFVSEKSGESNTFAPIDILDYIYAVLHSSKYREKYNEFLKIDYPKIPYPTSATIFWDFVKLGGELRKVHLLEYNRLNKISIGYSGEGDSKVGEIKYIDSKVYINEVKYFDFENVPDSEIIWNFHIGKYQPAQQWLKNRKGRELSYEDTEYYEKMINALCLTVEIMAKINEIDIE